MRACCNDSEAQDAVADFAAKRRILDILLLNCRLIDANLDFEMRKPFDLLVEGPLLQESGEGRS